MSDWQPIKSAPKDGTAVEVWGSGTGEWPAVASWCETYWGFHGRIGNLGRIEKWRPLKVSSP